MGYQTEEKYGTHLNIRYLRVFLMNLTSFYKFLVKIIRNFSMITMVKIYLIQKTIGQVNKLQVTDKNKLL